MIPIRRRLRPHYDSNNYSNQRSVVVIVATIFIFELLVMILIHLLPIRSAWVRYFLDATLLVILLLPSLYYFSYRPLQRAILAMDRYSKDLIESRRYLQTIVQTIPDAIIISRLEDSVIAEINDGFSTITGYAAKESIGNSSIGLKLWRNPEDRKKIKKMLTAEGQVNNLETTIRTKKGHDLHALISAKIIELDGRKHILSVIKDIEILKRTQQRIIISNRFLEIANQNRDVNHLLTSLVDEIKALLGCQAVGIRIIEGMGRYSMRSQLGFEDMEKESVQFVRKENLRRCLCSMAISGLTPVDSPNFTVRGSFYSGNLSEELDEKTPMTDRSLCGNCVLDEYESVAILPIRIANRVIGAIQLADFRKNLFSNEIILVLEEVIMQIGVAMERAFAEDALKKSNLRLEQIVERRSAQLQVANDGLQLEIQEKRLAEKRLLEHQRKLRRLSEELLQAQEEARKRLATELHDSIGHNLAISKMLLMELRSNQLAEDSIKIVDKILKKNSEMIKNARSMIFELSPPSLYSVGVRAALEDLAEQVMEEHEIQVLFRYDRHPLKLEDVHQFFIYSAARELLFNVVKHARAQKIVLSLGREGDLLVLTVEDEGIGLDPQNINWENGKGGGFGLFSIHERSIALGGSMEISAGEIIGTRVKLTLPLRKKHHTKHRDHHEN